MSNEQPGATPTNDAPGPNETATARRKTVIAPNRPKVPTNEKYDPFARVTKAGTVVIVNGDEAFDYRWTPTKDYPPDGRELDEWRNRLAQRGFAPRNGPRATEVGPEYHISEPTMEIWRRPADLNDDEWRAGLADLVLRPSFSEWYAANPGASGRRPPLDPDLRDAMYAFHDRSLPPEKRPTREELIELCREQPVHPGRKRPKFRWER